MKHQNIYRKMYDECCVFSPQSKKVIPPKFLTTKTLTFEK